MELIDLIQYLEVLSPPEYALDWDNSGLQVGTLNKQVENVSIALTPTLETITEAINNYSQVLITHHPLIFKSLKTINTDSPIGKGIELALKNNLTIYTMHTNFDSAASGLNYQIARSLGLDNINILSVSGYSEILKVVTFVPQECTLQIATTIAKEGARRIGNLSSCGYITSGLSTFSNENKDETALLKKEPEDKLEIIVPRKKLDQIISKIKEIHPYKDIVYEVFKLEDKSNKFGIGTIGEFYTPFTLAEVIDMVKRTLNLPLLSYVGDLNQKLEKVAICTGSGGDFIKLAKEKGADLYITGDIKYHTAIDAKELNLALIDAGHHGTEIIAVPFISKYIKEAFTDLNIFEVIETDPINYI